MARVLMRATMLLLIMSVAGAAQSSRAASGASTTVVRGPAYRYVLKQDQTSGVCKRMLSVFNEKFISASLRCQAHYEGYIRNAILGATDVAGILANSVERGDGRPWRMPCRKDLPGGGSPTSSDRLLRLR